MHLQMDVQESPYSHMSWSSFCGEASLVGCSHVFLHHEAQVQPLTQPLGCKGYVLCP